MKRLMRCQEALTRLAAYLDGEVRGAARTDLERHLATCRSCYSRAEFEKGLKSQIGRLREQPLQPALTARIESLLHRFTEEGRTP